MAYATKLFYYGRFDMTETADASTRPGVTAEGLNMSFDGANHLVQLSGLLDVVMINLTSDGDDSFDLTAATLARDLAETKDFSTKKLVAWAFEAGTGNNAAGMVIKAHATNGYPLFGTASDRITIFPGEQKQSAPSQVTTLYGTAVDATHKIIHITGTNLDTLVGFLLFK